VRRRHRRQPQVASLLRPIVTDLSELFARIPGDERLVSLGNYVGTTAHPSLRLAGPVLG